MGPVSQRIILLLCATASFATTRANADALVAPLDFTLPTIDNSATINNAGVKSAALINEASGVVINERGAVWNGDVAANRGQIGNQGVWNGSLANTSGIFLNDGSVQGDINNGGKFVNNVSGSTSGQLINSGSATNNGLISGGIANSGTFVNNTAGTVGYIANSGGAATNDGASGMIEVYGGNVVNAGRAGGAMVTSSGALQNSGEITGDVTAQGAVVNSGRIDGGLSGLGAFTNDGVVRGAVTDGDLVNNSDGRLAGGFSSGKGAALNNGVIDGPVGLADLATLTNNGVIQGNVSNMALTGGFVNNGRVVGDVMNDGASPAASFVNNSHGEITGTLTNKPLQSATNFGLIDGDVANSGQFLNASSGVVGGAIENMAGRAQNDGSVNAGASVAGGELDNNGLLKGAVSIGPSATLVNNAALTGALTNSGTVTNNAAGVVQSVFVNSGVATNSGSLAGAVANSGTFLNVASGSLQKGLNETGGRFVNHGLIADGVVISAGAVVSDRSITGGASIAAGAALSATGSLAGVINNLGTLSVSDASGSLGKTLSLAPGSTVSGVVTIPVNLVTGQHNELLAKGANVSAAAVSLTGSLANPGRAYWGAIDLADTPIALSAQSAAAIAALSDPLYVYAFANGAITQKVNPGLAGAAAYPVMAMLTTFNTAFFADPIEIARSAPDARVRGFGVNLWTRGSSSQLDISGQSAAGAAPGFNASKYVTRVAGDQIGVDAAIGDVGGSGLALHAGLTGGLARTSATDTLAPGVSATGSATFGGAYAAFEGETAFIGAAARYQRFALLLTDTPLAQANQGAQASGMSYSVEGGFRLMIADALFVEPSAAAIVSRLNVGAQTSNVGVLSYAPLVSELGRLGLRIGTGLQSGAFRVEPYLSGQFWREFAGQTTTYVQNGPTIIGSSTGSFTRLAFGLSASPSPNGFALFAEGAWSTGASVKGFGLNGGLRARF